MKSNIKIVRKQYKITIKELAEYCDYTYSYISRLENNQRVLKESHLLNIVKGINKILEKRNIDQKISIKKLLITSEKNLETLVNKSLIDKTIYNKEKRKIIEEFELKHEIHSLKYRYLIGKYYQNNKDYEKALKFYHNLLNDFDCSKFLYSILIEIIRLEKIEKTYNIFLEYQKVIYKASLKTKSLIYYNTGVNLLRCKKYNKAMDLFQKIINMPIKTKQYYKSWNNLGICLQHTGKYQEAIDAFKNRVSDPTNYEELKICYTNIISCAKELDNKALMKITLKKLEKILPHFKDKVIYQTYQCMGISYLYLNEEEKAIKAFEKDLYQKYDYSFSSFFKEKYIDSLEHLVKLYRLNTFKHQELIDHISKIPVNLLDKAIILKLLKYYFDNNMKYEGELLIKKLRI